MHYVDIKQSIGYRFATFGRTMTICRRFLVGLCLWIVFMSESMAQTQAADKLNAKSLEAVASYAQSLAQWTFIIIGGSLVLVLGNSHRWPKRRVLRATYFLFPLAWISLAISTYFGTRVQQAYLAYLVVPLATIESATRTLNEDLRSEITWMFVGLALFCVWLLVYMIWRILSEDVPDVRGAS